MAAAGLLALALTLPACASGPGLRERCYRALVGYRAVQAGVGAYLETPYGVQAPQDVLDGIASLEPVAAQAVTRGCGLLVARPELTGADAEAQVAESELARAEAAIARLVELYTGPSAYRGGP